MKFQAVSYQKVSGAPWRYGIARMVAFDRYEFDMVVDAETGARCDPVWNIHLCSGPLSYLEIKNDG